MRWLFLIGYVAAFVYQLMLGGLADPPGYQDNLMWVVMAVCVLALWQLAGGLRIKGEGLTQKKK